MEVLKIYLLKCISIIIISPSYDKKVSSGTQIGTVGIAIAQLFQNRGFLNKLWLPITHQSGFLSKSKKPAGEVEIEIQPCVAYKPQKAPIAAPKTKSASGMTKSSQGSNGRSSLRNTSNLLGDTSLTKPMRRSITQLSSMPGAVGTDSPGRRSMPLPVPHCYPGGFIPPVKLNNNDSNKSLNEAPPGNFSPPKASKKDPIPPACRFEPPDVVTLPGSNFQPTPQFIPPSVEG